MTVTLTIASLLLIAVLATLAGFAFGYLAAIHAISAKVTRLEAQLAKLRYRPVPARPPLPRPGLFPVDDDYPVLSENPAAWDRLERNVVASTSPLRAIEQ